MSEPGIQVLAEARRCLGCCSELHCSRILAQAPRLIERSLGLWPAKIQFLRPMFARLAWVRRGSSGLADRMPRFSPGLPVLPLLGRVIGYLQPTVPDIEVEREGD